MYGVTFWTLNNAANRCFVSSTISINHGSNEALTCSVRQKTFGKKVDGGICQYLTLVNGCTGIAKAFAEMKKFQPCTKDLGKATKGNLERIFTGVDGALGGLNVLGWSVEVEGKGEVSQASVMRSSELRSRELHHSSRLEPSGTQILIPIVDEFVKHADVKQKRLLMKPPDGLLELYQRPEAIRQLLPEIQQFCRRHAGFLQERFTRNKLIKYDTSEDLQQIVHTYMPTREQLQSLGRFDLARRIKAAGGFLFVAQSLGLKTTRRPNGFWDDLEKLDNEIEQFLQHSWVQKIHEETGMIYFENFATKEVALKRPIQSSGHQSSMVDSEGSRVMPQQMIFWKAHRWDLHHAIVWNGGYKEVAHSLRRRMLRTSKKFHQEQQNIIRLLAKDYMTAAQSISKSD